MTMDRQWPWTLMTTKPYRCSEKAQSPSTKKSSTTTSTAPSTTLTSTELPA
ncbi:hypothetical protein RHGRI_008876 [Rhododendron griersonianum]|uniref:Uncharacterized protein n=1 Tax=Rhododendron griersonianum TaxID=479676 RepID=A0AAV6L4H4_9ERIC|nr:hypothetical protein RHGRI_008876 [Rhododendron griersonianum]